MRLLLIFLFLSAVIPSFCYVPNMKRSSHHTLSLRHHSRLAMQKDLKVAIVGAAGGTAETLACILLEQSPNTGLTLLMDSIPKAPILVQEIKNKTKKIRLILGDRLSESKDLFLSGNQDTILVTLDEAGDKDIREEEDVKERKNLGAEMVQKVLGAIQQQDNAKALRKVICASAVDSDKSMGLLGGLLGGSAAASSAALKNICSQRNIPFSQIKYGNLLGGIPGKDVIPFASLPLIEPELHPSAALQSVVCSSVKDNQFASSEPCTRDALGSALARLVSSPELDGTSVDALLISIAGGPPSEKDWTSIFKRMAVTTSSGAVELLRVEFGQVLRAEQFLAWIAEAWFPTALIEANAATILEGARPVRANLNKKEGLVRINWEDLQPDLTVKSAGALEIRINQGSKPPYLSVVRSAPGLLPGETQLVDKLVEAINKNAYKKQFATQA